MSVIHNAGMAPRPQYRKTYIRNWRKKKNLTLERLADRIGMTPSNLSMLERGKRGYSQETLEALADELTGGDVASLLMRNPDDQDAIWSVWEQALPGEKRQIVEIAKTIIRTRAS